MILSVHHLTGFWFESDSYTGRGADESAATKFLDASLKAVAALPREGKNVVTGAINNGFDPSQLKGTTLPGYRWLIESLQSIKSRFGEDFDDAPGSVKDIENRRNPFPALHFEIPSPSTDGSLVLDRVKVLVGHDVAVVHEFSILSPTLDDSAIPPLLNEKRFAVAPDPSATLFTATLYVLSASEVTESSDSMSDRLKFLNRKLGELHARTETRFSTDDWSETEFAAASLPKFKAPLQCAIRSGERSYRGCVLVGRPSGPEKAGPSGDLHHHVEEHNNATGYLTFLCVLLVNDAKINYERKLADLALKDITPRLDVRLRDAEALSQTLSISGRASFWRDSLDQLNNAHEADLKLLYSFDQLVQTCQLNAYQFGRVAAELIDDDRGWAAEVRHRMSGDNTELERAKVSAWNSFNATEAKLNLIRQRDQRSKSELVDHGQIFISYSHDDGKEARDELKKHLPPALMKSELIGVKEFELLWDDTKIKPGDEWMSSIKTAIGRAKAAILLVTPGFIISDFITRHELPNLLEAEKEKGLLLLWIHVSASTYQYTDIAKYQFLHEPEEPLDTFQVPQRNRLWVEICKKIRETLMVRLGTQADSPD